MTLTFIEFELLRWRWWLYIHFPSPHLCKFYEGRCFSLWSFLHIHFHLYFLQPKWVAAKNLNWITDHVQYKAHWAYISWCFLGMIMLSLIMERSDIWPAWMYANHEGIIGLKGLIVDKILKKKLIQIIKAIDIMLWSSFYSSYLVANFVPPLKCYISLMPWEGASFLIK